MIVSKPSGESAFTQSKPLTDARHAYDYGMPLHIVKRRFHLSDSEAEDIAPEEFDDDTQADSVSGY